MKIVATLTVAGISLAILYFATNTYFGTIICSTTRVDAEMQALVVCLRQYKDKFGDFPRTNTWNALSGQNPKKTIFIEFRNRDFSDPWGTPYKVFFSDNSFLIHSAGKDKKFENGSLSKSDDIIYEN
jgi:hypothetical protein